ncbi:MAG: single-stranded-DNA-specific exonuclease RecJ [Candidatus Yonathbacteria bacterium]|nr:single-stranded-DNA-specific exonuclease RecJ [Candidatus Yonathbacteria bacterium]
MVKKKTEDNAAFSIYHPLTQTLLKNRGITMYEQAEKFLHPDYERDIHDPFLILNMEKAVERILRAIDAEEKIVVYGDYDCDGIPGSVILHDFFKKIGYKNFENYIPHRHDEGYGLNTDAVDEFAKNGTSLLITVDCGITDVKEVAHANSFGIDVIVTDHHLPVCRDLGTGRPQEVLPSAFAILNSKQKGDTYPDNMLCGAGLVWKLVHALLKKRAKEWNIGEGWEKWLLDMAGLSTIADMVPLRNENRVLAHYGLKVLRKSPRPGLMKLFRKLRVDQRYLTEEDVGFTIAPRVNAASRMGIPFDAFRLLSTTDETEADVLSDHLNEMNETRKGVVAVMIKEAKKKITSREMREVIVVGNPAWKPGVLGLAANRLMEDYGRPVFVWGREGGTHIKGSCRSDGSINVVELMVNVRQGIFLDVGGHELAGGFSISHEQIHFLEEEIILAYKKIEKKLSIDEAMAVESTLSLDQVIWDTQRLVDQFAPFGIGNPKPLFLFEGVEIKGVKTFGKEKNHLELQFENSSGKKIPAIGFFISPENFKTVIEEGKFINLVATLEKSMFRGRPELRLRIVDIQNPKN